LILDERLFSQATDEVDRRGRRHRIWGLADLQVD
jgi:hypothetical protein